MEVPGIWCQGRAGEFVLWRQQKSAGQLSSLLVLCAVGRVFVESVHAHLLVKGGKKFQVISIHSNPNSLFIAGRTVAENRHTKRSDFSMRERRTEEIILIKCRSDTLFSKFTFQFPLPNYIGQLLEV